MSRLRVLFITAAYPTPEEPVQSVFVREHAKAVASFAEVVVVHGPHLKKGARWRLAERPASEINEDLRTFDLTYRASSLPKTHWLMFLHAAARVHESLLGHGFVPNLVHANYFNAAVPAAVIAKLAAVPMVLTEHASEIPRRLLTPREQFATRLGYASASLVMPVSHALLDGIHGYGLYPPYQIVSNAVDTELFFWAPKKNRQRVRLLFVGGMVPVKGVHGLLAACARLIDDPHPWELELVGEGPDRTSLERCAAEMGLADRTRFVGALPKKRVAERMRDADFLVLPSLWENLPCVALEAMCCGLPLVATRVGGIPEILNDTNSILCEPRDPAALAEALASMLANPDRFDREAISVHARGRFTREVVATQLERIYREVLGRREVMA